MNAQVRWRLRLKAEAFFGAAFTFWVPDVVIHAIRRADYSGVDVVVVSALLPIVTCTAAVPYLVWRYGREPPLSIAVIGVLGIWVSGPFMMMLTATFSGGGFALPLGVVIFLLGTLLFPLFTFMMATYDGSLLALAIATIVLPLTPGLIRATRRSA